MAFDTVCIKKLTEELSKALTDGRIDKIHQPEKDELIISVRTKERTYKLTLSASPNNPRIHFTELSKENPKTCPMFCMLLRKHLSGGKILSVRQAPGERVIIFDTESRNELGDLTVKHLICEIMGRNSNIILCLEDMKIADCARHVDLSLNTVRQLLPGFFYEMPPKQDKTPFFSEEIKSLSIDFSKEQPEKSIMGKVSGISPLTCRELIFRALGKTNLQNGELSDIEKDKISKEISAFSENPEFAPCIVYDALENPVEFSAIPIKQYGSGMKVKYFDTVSEVISEFYRERDRKERMHRKSANIVKLLKTNIERCAKKLTIQQATMHDAKNKERYKIFGDLVTASLYRIPEKSRDVTVENYYEDGCPSVKIELLPTLSPAKNAQRYYKLYQKLKNAEIEVAKQIKATSEELEYLESTLVLTENCMTESDLNEIRSELSDLGYIKNPQSKKRTETKKSSPMHFVSEDGFDIYVGKNNTQNDYLTLRFANSGDIWFHTKNIHGSHTVIKLGIKKDVPEGTMRRAAELAAYYSKARESSQVPVDYTSIKNVKKPSGAKPGMVIYDNYNTVYVTPKPPSEDDV